MMSSRSVIWTLTQQQPPAPSPTICQELAQELQANLPMEHAKYDLLKNVDSVTDPALLFSHDQPVLLMPSPPNEYPDPFLAALVNLKRAGERQRPGRVPVRQWISPEFVGAALSQWVRDDGGKGTRINMLRTTDTLDRLVDEEFLTESMRQQLREEPDRLPLIVPDDFCDDGKNGLDLGLGPEFSNARKVCYGVFRESRFPKSALKATNPELWDERFPQFWRHSDVLAKADRQDDQCHYQAGLLEEVVNLPNYPKPFGPVALTFVRTTAKDGTWSRLTYKLADQNAMKVNQGWYLVQRRLDSASAAIMVKVIEFDGDNDWLDSVCETGLLGGARELLGIDQDSGERRTRSGRARAGQGAGQGGPLSSVVGDYLDGCRRQLDQVGNEALVEMRHGLAEFESKPWRFGWIDSAFGVIDHSTAFLATATRDWANVVQKNLPAALAQADSSAVGQASTPAGQASTPAYLVVAGWKTALGISKVGYDLSRAMLQFLGPGMGQGDMTIVEVLSQFEQSGYLATVLQNFGVTNVGAATQMLLNTAPRAQSVAEFDAYLDRVLQNYAQNPPAPQTRTPFAQEVWNMLASRGRAAGT